MLYIVGTTLGNSEDISLRAARVLCESDVILAEDTRTFQVFYRQIQKLFSLAPLDSQKIISFHDQNEFKQTPYILKMLEIGKEIALVSESGMPLISDPGHVLLKEVIKNKLEYTIVPAATAFVNAIALSGFSAENIMYIGFFSKKPSEVRKVLRNVINHFELFDHSSVVFYESPHRINQTLEIIDEMLPRIEVAVCREMTKKFEEILIGKASELKNKPFKGELAVVLSQFKK